MGTAGDKLSLTIREAVEEFKASLDTAALALLRRHAEHDALRMTYKSKKNGDMESEPYRALPLLRMDYLHVPLSSLLPSVSSVTGERHSIASRAA